MENSTYHFSTNVVFYLSLNQLGNANSVNKAILILYERVLDSEELFGS